MFGVHGTGSAATGAEVVEDDVVEDVVAEVDGEVGRIAVVLVSMVGIVFKVVGETVSVSPPQDVASTIAMAHREPLHAVEFTIKIRLNDLRPRLRTRALRRYWSRRSQR